MTEFIFKNDKGEFPDLADSYKRQFAARGETLTALVLLTKKDGKLETAITWMNKKNIARFGGKRRIIEAIKKRVIEKNYDLFVEEGKSTMVAM